MQRTGDAGSSAAEVGISFVGPRFAESLAARGEFGTLPLAQFRQESCRVTPRAHTSLAAGTRARKRLQRSRAAMVETGGSEEMQTMDGARSTACSRDSAASSFDESTLLAMPDSASTCASINAPSSSPSWLA